MNPIIEETLAALIAHGTIAVISHLVPEKISTLRKEELLTHFLEKDQKLAVILQKAAAGVAKSAHTGDPRQDEKLKLFLISPDAEAIIRQMFGMNLVRDAKAHSEGILQREFRACLALHLGGKPEATAELADPLFDALVAGCERALAHAIDRGVLSAHEAKSASRHRALLDELDTIKENLRFLNQPTKPNLDEILEFEPRYRQQVAERYGYITPPNFDAARKLPIRNIYVSPSLIEASQNKDGDPITLETFLASMYRAVVLGNPGGGKSTLASKICFDLASGYGSRLLAGRQVTPI